MLLGIIIFYSVEDPVGSGSGSGPRDLKIPTRLL